VGFFLFLQGGTRFGDLFYASESFPNSLGSPSVRTRLNEVAVTELKQLIYVMMGNDSERVLVGPPALIKKALRDLGKDKRVKITESHIAEG